MQGLGFRVPLDGHTICWALLGLMHVSLEESSANSSNTANGSSLGMGFH